MNVCTRIITTQIKTDISITPKMFLSVKRSAVPKHSMVASRTTRVTMEAARLACHISVASASKETASPRGSRLLSTHTDSKSKTSMVSAFPSQTTGVNWRDR